MNIVTVLTAVAVIGVSVFALEGLSVATGGEFYLASIQHLAQNTVESTRLPTTEAAIQVEPIPPVEPATGTGIQMAPMPSDQVQPTNMPPGDVIMKPLEPIQNIQPGGQQFMPKPQCAPGTTCDQGQVRQEIRNSGDENRMMEMEDNQQQDFVDPKEVQRILKEIANMRSEIKRIISQNKKTAGASDITELNAVLEAANSSYTAIRNSSDSDMRSNMQEFYEGQYWERIQAVRTRLEIPRELKQMAPIFKRLEKTLSTKAIQNIGLDIGKAQQRIAEMKSLVDQIRAAYNGGDMETAMETMQELRESGGHPGEIESTIFRFRDIKNMVKRVKDEQVRNEVNSVLQEVVSAFNEGEYRQARETMDEYADDLQRLLNTLIRSKINNKNRRDSLNKVSNLESLIQSKLGNSGTQQTQPQ